ncbi:MAG TPA: DUF1501 domain-containing protein [Saprospiraceae bacterium]|nr:DUF1501 domain-containing protein [Saprospiraceae bacterium]
MKRRDFVKYTGGLSLGPMFLNRIPLNTFATHAMLPLLACEGVEDRTVVIVFLDGGNDGLNAVIPVDQYGLYYNLRPDLAIPQSGPGAYIMLDNTLPIADQVGVHPAMTSFKTMYDNGFASLIQGVGYPDSNGSHFKSTDLWLTGGDGTAEYFNIGSGWMGRFLHTVFPGLNGNPTEANPDPLGIQLGDTKPSPGFYDTLGKFQASNLSQQDPGGLFNQVQGVGTPNQNFFPESEYGEEIAYIMAIENAVSVYAQRISNTFNAGINDPGAGYTASFLSDQLRTVARLISGGSKTKVFLVRTGGFDTHADQVVGGNTSTGWHADLLNDVFDSVKAFHDDMTAQGHAQKLLTMTFSEFGRKVEQNGSFGTDHGNLAPMFLFGSGVQPGVHGTNLDLSDVTNNGTVPDEQLQFDYRRVFRSVIQDWLGGSGAAIMGTQFDQWALIPGIIKPAETVDPTCYFDTYITQSVVRARVFLEGFYDPEAGKMRTILSDNNMLPLQQPYQSSPYSYNGTEALSDVPDHVVDWILIELRDGNDVNNVLGRRAGLLRRDGQVIGLNGGLGVAFNDLLPNAYYITIYHRSHIAVISSQPMDLVDVTNVYDFTIDGSAALGTGQLKEVNGTFVLFAGDYNGSGIADAQDYSRWRSESSGIGDYDSTDGDGNGIVNNLDYNLWKRNENQTGHPAIQL